MIAQNPEDHPWLRGLARRLVARHLNVSIPEYELRRELLAAEEPKVWKQCQRKFRCIAVVGAGASAPVLARGDDLASGLTQNFNIELAAVEAEKERLERITAVDPTEFEAQLSAIGQTLGNSRRVRAVISDLYQLRHPTILAYELLAHLVKHRFVDAVVNMNFDELLDQSLDDELGVGEYERIVSDRDCVNAQSDVFAPDYVPLHIKLHGTASEPESLRFTRESYYDSPVGVGTLAARLFEIPDCVVLNIGFGMTSFDLHRLLAIPDRLRLYNLSHDPLTRKARKAIWRERRRKEKTRPMLFESEENEATRAEEKEDRKARKEARDKGLPPPPPLAPSDERTDASDLLMDLLLKQVSTKVKGLSQGDSPVAALRPAKRHRTVVKLLGPETAPGKRLIALPRTPQDHRLSLDPMVRAARPDSVLAGYLRRRTILELALAMARGRGLVSISTLAVDRSGLYYDAYCRQAGKHRSSWRELCTLVGFTQNPEVPDVVEAIDEIRATDPARRSPERRLREELLAPVAAGEKDHWHELPRLDMKKLTERVLPQIVDSPSKLERGALRAELDQLYRGSEYEIHSRDDRVCAKTFSHPRTLKTLSSFNAYSFELVKYADNAAAITELDVISETGDWLLRPPGEFADRIRRADRIRLIVAFLGEVPKLRKEFPGILLAYQQPWHHNRHMAIVREDGLPLRALYFARHHRTPYVNPVLVKRRKDIRMLQTTFDDRWATAEVLPEEITATVPDTNDPNHRVRELAGEGWRKNESTVIADIELGSEYFINVGAERLEVVIGEWQGRSWLTTDLDDPTNNCLLSLSHRPRASAPQT
jgi:hypothetical protein